jgi:hypothetical protein
MTVQDSPSSCLTSLEESGTPRSMPGTYCSSAPASPQKRTHDLPANVCLVPPLNPLRARVQATTAELQACTQQSAQAALRQAAATGRALSVIEQLSIRLDEHQDGEAFANAALDGAAENQVELKSVIADQNVQLVLERQELEVIKQSRDAHVAEAKHVKERLRFQEKRCSMLQVRMRLAGCRSSIQHLLSLFSVCGTHQKTENAFVDVRPTTRRAASGGTRCAQPVLRLNQDELKWSNECASHALARLHRHSCLAGLSAVASVQLPRGHGQQRFGPRQARGPLIAPERPSATAVMRHHDSL